MKKIVICIFLLIIKDCFMPPGAAGLSARPTRPVTYPVRVAVLNNASAMKLRVNGGYTIRTLPLLEDISSGTELRNISVLPTYSGLKLGDEEMRIYGVNIKTGGTADIYVNGRRFRGEMDIIRTESMKLMAINHLDIEDYVSGVLYHEVSHWWPVEAIKAQAIASRTFAVFKTLESAERDYDLTADTFSQVYGGKTSERFRTNRAVRQTEGKILVYDNKVLPAYFHATCGGHTEDASVLWNTELKPLKGRRCVYCERSPYYRWQQRLSLGEIEKKLNAYGYTIKKIRDIRVSSRDASDRVSRVKVIDSLGTERIPAHKFRMALGPNLIRSTNFDVSVKDKEAVFKGKGWGHGVGMCQWGAYYMARLGFKAEDILKFYYPGAKVVFLSDVTASAEDTD